MFVPTFVIMMLVIVCEFSGSHSPDRRWFLFDSIHENQVSHTHTYQLTNTHIPLIVYRCSDVIFLSLVFQVLARQLFKDTKKRKNEKEKNQGNHFFF